MSPLVPSPTPEFDVVAMNSQALLTKWEFVELSDVEDVKVDTMQAALRLAAESIKGKSRCDASGSAFSTADWSSPVRVSTVCPRKLLQNLILDLFLLNDLEL